MIVPPKQDRRHLATDWMAGIALAMVIAGAFGASQPLLPRGGGTMARLDSGSEVLLEQFDPPSAASGDESPELQSVEEPDIEIPPLPAIQTPLVPPEMIELTPLDESPPPSVVARQDPAQPKSPFEPRRTPASNPGAEAAGAATTFTGGGSGRFPPPTYPLLARANREQGIVKVLVMVEANGLPSSVTIQSSSGYPTLDNAARDQITRRWRWPVGGVRHYIVPVRFILQP